MRPYIAILKDSFREAFASRLLWILLLFITLFLLAIAPLGYRESITMGLREGAVREWPELIERIRSEGRSVEPSPGRRVWDLLDPSIREKMESFAMPKEGDMSGAFEMMRTLRALPPALDQVLRRADFYEERIFENTQLVSEEARQLKDDYDELTDDEKRRFNRLLFEAAYPDLVRASPRTSVNYTYLMWDASPPYPVGARGFARQLDSRIALVMKWFIGVLGIFLAILVTAPILPQTLEPGSLNLLLSKPISRWRLFITKYFGGCAFILIAAAYLIGGIWLLLGLRFGIWNSVLLISILIYGFIFAVYYAVSALAGVLWRSTIVAVVLTVLFWLLCSLVGLAKVSVESSLLDKTRIVKLIEVKGELISTNEMGLTSHWKEDEREWKETFVSDDQRQLRPMMFLIPLEGLPPTIGPVYDTPGDQLLAVQRSLQTRKLEFNVGRRDEQWECVTGAVAPPGTFSLLREPDGRVLAISALGLFRVGGDPAASPDPLTVLGVEIPFTGSRPYRSVGPERPVILAHPAAAALNTESGTLAVYSRGVVTLLRENENGKYQRLREKILNEGQRHSVALAFGGDSLLIGRADGSVIVLDADDLRERARFVPERRSTPRYVAAAPQGRWFAIVFRNRRLWMFDAADDTLQPATVVGQGDISAAAFTGPDQLLVADRSTRIMEYEIQTGEIRRRVTPTPGLTEWVYRYGILPLYTVFPKPGELDKTIEYLLAERQAAGRNDAKDVDAARAAPHSWSPIWSSLAFAIVLLAAGCICIERREY